MEVVNSKGAVLSNYEVYTLLQEVCQQGNKGKRDLTKTQAHLANIAFDTLKYLEKTPCKHQKPEAIQRFLEATKNFKLTKAEKLQLINLRPVTPVEMQLIIEESEDRLSEEQVEQLISLVEQHLPDPAAAATTTTQMTNGPPQ